MMYSIITSAIIIAVTIVLLEIIGKFGDRMIRTKDIHWKFTLNIFRAVVVIFAIAIIMMQFTITKDISKVLLQSSALFVAIAGFAAQTVLADVIAGLMISWSKPFNIGERINIESKNIVGIVEDITLRQTVIRSFDNNRIILPNSVINKEILRNSDNRDGYIGNYMEISVGYQSDLRKALEIFAQTILDHPLVIDQSKDPSCDRHLIATVKEFGESGIVLKATIWTKTVDDNFMACSEIRISLKENFEKNDIEIPYVYRHVILEQKKEK